MVDFVEWPTITYNGHVTLQGVVVGHPLIKKNICFAYHISHAKVKPTFFAMTSHITETNHQVGFDQIKKVDAETSLTKRTFLQPITSTKTCPTLKIINWIYTVNTMDKFMFCLWTRVNDFFITTT